MSFYDKHRETLEKAIKAVHERTFFAQYPEHPKPYGEEAPKKGEEEYNKLLNSTFNRLLQEGSQGEVGKEVSPYTQKALGVKYPSFKANDLVNNAEKAWEKWREESPEERAAVLFEGLEKVKERFFEIAHATVHTTGQSFMMSFQASGPHSNDRALEAVAMGLAEQTRFPKKTDWKKNMGKFDVELEKWWRPIPKGVNLVIGVSTFPVWNSVPGIFAGLVTGNPVIAKPHPGSILPLAIVIAEMQKVFKEAGYDPNLLQLAADNPDAPITKEIAEDKRVKLIDYTGGTEFGDYVESLETKGKTTFTEKAGVNSIILDSVKDLKPVFQNVSFSLSLYSGQMCTAPQNIFIPEDGIEVGGDRMPYDEVIEHLVKSVEGLANHPKMGAGTLAAIQNPATCKRVEEASKLGKVLLESKELDNPEYPDARTQTPMILEVEADKVEVFNEELFGPIVLVVKTKSTDQSAELVRDLIAEKGAITCSAYVLDFNKKQMIQSLMERVYAPVSFNFVGPIWVNQNAAFSDFHLTGGNAAGNASFTDANFVNKRFVWVGHKEVV